MLFECKVDTLSFVRVHEARQAILDARAWVQRVCKLQLCRSEFALGAAQVTSVTTFLYFQRSLGWRGTHS